MAKKRMANRTTKASAIQDNLNGRPELKRKYGDNALPLLGLALYVQADDVDALAAEALTDGGNDKKIDFCFIDRSTGYAAITQGYTSQTWGKTSAAANKATDLVAAVGWLFTGDVDKDVPEKLRDTVTELREAINDKEISRIEFLYIHNCHESDNVKHELKTVVQLASSLLVGQQIAISATELGLTSLDSLCLASQQRIFVPETVTVASNSAIKKSGATWSSVVASVTGDWLHDLNLKYGTKLTRGNYRDFLGIRNSVKNINNGIKGSVQAEADNFWTYNNGITALAQKITKVGRKYQIDGLSIINGAQTTGAIAECTREEAAKIAVLCRFVQCSDDGILHNIIRYNNTQNAFRTSDQRSNDAIQKRLAAELIPLGITYFHRRSAIKNPKGSVSAESIAPLLCAFHGDPQTAARRRDDIFDADPVYDRVFPPSCKGEHLLMVHCLGAAIDEVKLTLKEKTSSKKATATEQKNYEVLKYSTSKLFVLGIIGKVAEEIVGQAIPDLYQWRFKPEKFKKGLDKLVFPWKETVEAVLPLVGSVVGSSVYQATRDFRQLSDLSSKVAAIMNAAGSTLTDRFAPLRDVTDW